MGRSCVTRRETAEAMKRYGAWVVEGRYILKGYPNKRSLLSQKSNV